MIGQYSSFFTVSSRFANLSCMQKKEGHSIIIINLYISDPDRQLEYCCIHAFLPCTGLPICYEERKIYHPSHINHATSLFALI